MSSTTDTSSTSTQQVVTSLIFNGAIFGVFIAAFLLLRLKLKRTYEPKSSFDLINDEKKPEPLPRGIWQWFMPLLKKSDNFIIQQAGLDGYFFIRYLYILCLFFAISFVWIGPILLPINAANGVKKSGLDMLAYQNVKHPARYYADVFLAWIFYWGFLYIIYRELLYYTSLRQAVLASPRYAKKLSSRTVLFQSVPPQYLVESEFRKLFTGVKEVWIARGASELAKKVGQRDQMAMKLEAAETSYLKKAVKVIAKKKKKNPDFMPSSTIQDYVPDKKRPTHRLKPIIGKKVDTINYLKEEIPKLNSEIEELQISHMEAPPFNSVFVEFDSQYTAQMAVQSVIHHSPLSMVPAYAGIEPQDVVWFNMRMHWLERAVRKFGAVAAIIALIVLWAFPVAFVGMISNINALANKVHFIDVIVKNLGKTFRGLLTAMAPTVALAVLMMVLPIFIRKMALVAGSPSHQHVEYFTQQAFFGFQVIQVFLITTLASSATSVVTEIVADPTSAMDLLAHNLPKSSNFYISYIILQGLSVSSGALLQLVPLILFYVLSFILDTTARKKWARFTGLGSMAWGTTFPVYTNLAVVVFSYAIIAPIILLFAAVAFFLLYVAYLYNLTYVFQESPDSRGAHYPRALYQLMVGIYIGQVCLLGLFAVGKGWGPIVLQCVGLGVTVFIHLNLNSAFDRLMTCVPVDTMKPLDGKSDTPSFSSSGFVNEKDSIKELPQFPVRKYQPRSSLQLDQNTTSIRSENTYEVNGTVIYDNENNVTTVPLLADGDDTVVPPAPFWKRYFKPHIYLSYKVARSRLPEIYNLRDPNEMTSTLQIKHAYDYPAVSAKCPYLWIPKDPYGFSTVEIADLQSAVEITDEGAEFTESGDIIWNTMPPSSNYDDVEKENPFKEEDEDAA
ncbi:LAFE_0G07756g1_1 [Lachancea fermentati]|uniref:LAFE_0G07756g1_1 n=1 Tax=Lachancea fermentati TaxID=4955 RepID=A0A1G4MHQ0_LACFM|nr:LAFE_0G07756g1_1 [Lachancea fermentati]